MLSLELVPVPKVIDEVQRQFPKVKLLSFKYEVDKAHHELLQIAYDRLKKGHTAIIANRWEEMKEHGDQVSYLVTNSETPPTKIVGKPNIANSIRKFLEINIENETKN